MNDVAEVNDLQRRCGQWHEARFPDADVAAVALKLAEETGEVCEAVNKLLGVNAKEDIDPEQAREEVLAELGDVLIVALTIAQRFTNGNVSDALNAKLAVLTDPNGGHRGSVAVSGCLPTDRCDCLCHRLSDGLGMSHAVACCDSEGRKL